MSGDEPTLTMRDRLTAAGLSAARIEQHVAVGRVRVDGEPVTDLDGRCRPERGSWWAEQRASNG